MHTCSIKEVCRHTYYSWEYMYIHGASISTYMAKISMDTHAYIHIIPYSHAEIGISFHWEYMYIHGASISTYMAKRSMDTYIHIIPYSHAEIC
jgi:hypothetical protein